MQMTTLGHVQETVEELSKNHWDDIIDTYSLLFTNLAFININGENHNLMPMAQRAMCDRLNIPIQYLRRCPPDIQAQNLNYWIKSITQKELFFRFDGDAIRSIFSTRYVPINHSTIIEKLLSNGYTEETEAQFSIDENFMMLSIANGVSFSIKKKDKIKSGLNIGNSEDGSASFSISAFFLRLICTNGLIMATTDIARRFKHVSKKILDNFDDIIGNVSCELEQQKSRFKLSKNSKVSDADATINSFNAQFQLSTLEKEAVEWALPMETGDSMYNILNVYTKASQFSELSVSSSWNLQKVGGQILSLLAA